MLRRLGIRAKVLAVLAVPMLVVLLAGVFISVETLRDLRDARTARDVVDLMSAYVPLGDALNAERMASLNGGTTDEISAARQQTDAAAAAFRDRASGVDLAGLSSTLVPRFDEVERELDEDLPRLRTNVDIGVLRIVGPGFASFVATELSFFDAVAQVLPNRELATYLSADVDIARTGASLVDEYVDGVALLGRTDSSEIAGQAYTTIANQTEVLRSTARTAVDDLEVTNLRLPAGDPSVAFTQVRTILGSGNTTQISAVSAQTYGKAFDDQMESFTETSNGVLTQADSVAARAIGAAQQRAVLTIGIAIAAAAASLVLALIVSRAIVIPLRRLTAAAADVREELPRLVEQVQVPGEGPQMALPQIPVTTRDEVGRLASAFNSVNATTIQVAQEQAALRGSIAEMFVNVARRDQVLLNRQLSFIDSLERTEEDPQALANLFRLDHLATRMRRNAESLLVLAGIDSGRRLRDTLPLSDVVRTASSEIEQYDRIQLDLQADPHMLGFNALPAAHLLAELLENATVFSEPETPVVVATAVSGTHIEVRIIDQGLGMSDAELAAANQKIASTAASTALGAQRLGLFVVGRLAQRLSAEVVLRKSRSGANGTETIVRFPASLFQSTESSPLGVYGSTVTAPPPEAAPVVSEVDLAALTDGVTDQGLPRRRTGDAGPSALPVRQRGGDDAIVLPEVTAAGLPEELPSAPGWSPLVAPAHGSDLPSRSPAAGVAPGADEAARTASPADPAARAGLFAGFRGRGSLTAGGAPEAEPVEPVVPEADEPTVAAVDEVAGPPAPAVPGLMPDEPVGVADDAAAGAPSWPSWATSAPWAEPADQPADQAGAPGAAFAAEPVVPAEPGVPAVPAAPAVPGVPVEPQPDALPSRSAHSHRDGPDPSTVEPWVPPVAEPAADAWTAPAADPWVPQAAEPWAAPAEPAAEPVVQPVAESWMPSAPEPAPTSGTWVAPEADVARWPAPDQQVPSFEPEPGAFAGLDGWAQPAAPEAEAAPYAPFGHTLGEAEAWATGAIPVVPEPAGFDGGVAEAPGYDPGVTEAAAFGPGVTEPAAGFDPVVPGPATTGAGAEAPVGEAAGPAPAEAEEAWQPPASGEPEPWQPPAWAAQAWSAEGGFAIPQLVPDDEPPWGVDGQADTALLQPVEPEPDEVAPAAPAPDEVAPAAAEVVEPPVPAPPVPAPPVASSFPSPPVPEPPAPSWVPTVVSAPVAAESFADLVRGDAPEAKRRRWPFGRRRPVDDLPGPLGPAPVAEPAPPVAAPLAPAPAAPVRTSAWAPGNAPSTPAPPPPVAAPTTGWSPQAAWEPPAPEALPERAPAQPTAATWSPPEWAPRPAAVAQVDEPVVAATPAADTRIGTLDDEVAAMLALRSDIQEQALSELSQLSAYRPQVVHGTDRLTRRVPTAVPEAPSIVDAGTAERDPDEVRSRLASFQSGTARGRRDAGRDGEAT